MKKYFYTIRFRMFTTNAIIIMLMVVILSLFMNFFIIKRFKDNAYSNLISKVETHLTNLEKEIASMDMLALNILTSHIIKSYLNEDATTEDVQKTNSISAQLSSIVAPSFAVPRAMLHDFNSHSYNSQYKYYKEIDVKKLEWYESVIDKNGLIYLTSPYYGDDKNMSTDIHNSQIMISLCRLAFDTYQRPKGIVEVVQYYKKIFSSLNKLAGEDEFTKIIVYNEQGTQIYPFEDNGSIENYLDLIDSRIESELFTPQLIEMKINNENSIIGYQKSKALNWSIVLVSDKKTVMQSVNDYVVSLIVSALIVFILALIISFFASKQITAPILDLRKRMQKFNVSELEPDKKEIERSKLLEIEDLNQSFFRLSTELKDSVREQMLAHQHELQFKMLALQSQMNPHFLYNSLAMISAMAEEKMTEDIIYSCKNLSFMLRYIATGKDNIVSIESELNHTVNFLDFMKLRYKDKLIYEVEMPEELLKLDIPKLSIQPLVENSVKYCTIKAAPWKIFLRGKIDNDGWTISVIDNGIGISNEAIDDLFEKIRILDEESITSSLKLDGMGLQNLYVRLKLLYKDKMYFSIENLNNEGTIVSIGKKDKV